MLKHECIHCGNRLLLEKYYDMELKCSHAKCLKCKANLIIWINNGKVALIEDENNNRKDDKNE